MGWWLGWDGLSDVEEAVCLEGEAPLGMGEHGFHTGLHIGGALGGVCHVAGLEEAVGGLDVGVGVEILMQIHHFKFIAAGEHAGMGVGAGEAGFGRKRDPVERWRQGVCAVGFDGDLLAGGRFEALHEIVIDKKGGFAAGEHHPWCGILEDLPHDVVKGKQGAMGMAGVAKFAVQVAPGEAHKHRWYACVKSLALKGIEYFVDTILHRFRCSRWVPNCRRCKKPHC